VIAVTLGTTITFTLASVLGNSISLGNIIRYLLVGLLVILSIMNHVWRETIEAPKRFGAMQSAGPRTAFITGLLLLSIFPSDFIIPPMVRTNLVLNNSSLLGAVPFIAATILLAALPAPSFLSYLLFRRRAMETMPKVRNWTNTKS